MGKVADDTPLGTDRFINTVALGGKTAAGRQGAWKHAAKTQGIYHKHAHAQQSTEQHSTEHT
jgi:hypothetical protein